MLEQSRALHTGGKYVVRELANEFRHGSFHIRILFLLVAHPELNPIEMVWGTVKRAVSNQNG